MNDRVDRSDLTAEELAEARRYSISIEWSAEDDAFIVSVPDLPGVHTHGATREEAAAMGDEVIAVSLTAMRRRGRPIPPPSPYSGSEMDDQPPAFTAKRIGQIRLNLNASQEEFAQLLNVSLATVRAWGQGVWPPDGAAERLLSITERHPEIVRESARVSGTQSEQLARTG
jgi:predicted RNase H-like HicB family nuclease/DNA-binding XRE family transcriptional regulator